MTLKPLAPAHIRYPETLERFNADVSSHNMSVLLDQGVYRHLVFSNGSWHNRFEIITTPGQLTLRGDMGAYAFARENDMITDFFSRSQSPNVGYWAEKVEAQDIHCPIREHQEDLFKKFVLEAFWEARDDLSRADAAELWTSIREHMFDEWEDRSSADACFQLLSSFVAPGEVAFEFHVDYGTNFKDYSSHYLWACHAIVWATQHYLEHKATQSVSVTPTEALEAMTTERDNALARLSAAGGRNIDLRTRIATTQATLDRVLDVIDEPRVAGAFDHHESGFNEALEVVQWAINNKAPATHKAAA